MNNNNTFIKFKLPCSSFGELTIASKNILALSFCEDLFKEVPGNKTVNNIIGEPEN